jgi:Fibronectin type III domain
MTEQHRCSDECFHSRWSIAMHIRTHHLVPALLLALVTACSDDDPTTSTVAPSAPTAVAASIGDASLSIAFSPPASDGGSAITNYTATCSDANGSVVANGTSSPVVVTGLTNGTEYRCTVAATNSVGTGEASEAVVAVPAATVSMGDVRDAAAVASNIAGWVRSSGVGLALG